VHRHCEEQSDDPPSLASRAMARLESAEAPERVGGSNPDLSFRDGPKDQARNLEILRCAIAHHSSLVSLAPRNDNVLDCFAEPVIGRAFARPVGSQ
jgi:hypothetical protein